MGESILTTPIFTYLHYYHLFRLSFPMFSLYIPYML